MKLFENFNKPIRLRKKIFLKQLSDYDERSINKGQSIYDEMSHNVVYLFSIRRNSQWHIFIFNPKFGQFTLSS